MQESIIYFSIKQHFHSDELGKDYHSFGMLMPGRNYSSESYRYGFNNKEKDNEIKGIGNSIDFGARIYDPRIAKWLSLDPEQQKYPFLSPYNFVAGNPIIFVDPDGKIVKVATLDAQAQTLEILTKAFGEKATGFSFKDNELVFTGDPTSFSGREDEVFKGLYSVMTSETVTNIVYEKNASTDAHGGESTTNIKDNPSLKENTVTIDPVELFVKKIGENYVPEYVGKYGGKTTNPDFAKTGKFGEPIKSGTYKVNDVIVKDSKAARFFHGLGHIIYQKNSEQYNVVIYENKARSIFKKRDDKGEFKKAREEKRESDDKHINKKD